MRLLAGTGLKRRNDADTDLEQRRRHTVGGDCVALVQRMGWPFPPRSSCWMCPNMRMEEWREVIQFDRDLRKRDPHAWLTDQAVPIDQADFDEANDVLFGRERGACHSGMCFV